MNEPQGQAPTLSEHVAGEVRACLGRARMSGRATAFRLGWTQQYMSRRLTGVIPFDVADLEAIAGLFGVPVVDFFRVRGGFADFGVTNQNSTDMTLVPPATRVKAVLAA